MTVYLLYFWFLDGDGYLVAQVHEIYRNLSDASKTAEAVSDEHDVTVYYPDDSIPTDDNWSRDYSKNIQFISINKYDVK